MFYFTSQNVLIQVSACMFGVISGIKNNQSELGRHVRCSPITEGLQEAEQGGEHEHPGCCMREVRTPKRLTQIGIEALQGSGLGTVSWAYV